MAYETKRISDYSDKRILQELKRVAALLNKDTVTVDDFKHNAKIHPNTISSRFGNWNKALQMAGLRISKIAKHEPQDILSEIKRVWDMIGKQPSTNDIKKHSRVSLSSISRRYGSFMRAIEAMSSNEATHSSDSVSDDFMPNVQQVTSTGTGKRERPKYGTIINFRGMQHAPLNELGVVFLFGMLAKELGYSVEAISASFPDCEAKKYDTKTITWERIFIEFEYRSSSFEKHGHDPKQCDLIVCWEHDWKSCPIDVLALSDVIAKIAPNKALHTDAADNDR